MEPEAFLAAAEAAFARAAALTSVHDMWLRLAGRRVCLRLAGTSLDAAVEPPFDHLRGDAAEPADLTLLLWDYDDSGVAPPPRPWAAEAEGVMGRVAGYGGERFEALIDMGGRQVWMLDRARGRGFVWVRGARELPAWDRAHPLRQILAAWAATQGLQLVHAGAAGFDGAGALIVGPGGSGKSTTVLACIGAGARAAGDDYVLVEHAPAPVAHSIYGTMRLFESHARRFPSLLPEADAVSPGHDGAPKLTAYVSRRLPASFARSLPLAAIIVPQVVAGGRTRIRRAKGGAALFALAPSTLKQVDPLSRAAFERMARLCRALPCWRLELGADLDAAGGEVRRAIAESAAGAPAPA